MARVEIKADYGNYPIKTKASIGGRCQVTIDEMVDLISRTETLSIPNAQAIIATLRGTTRRRGGVIMDASIFSITVVISVIVGLLLGWATDSDRAFLQDRIVWADKVCESHGGADSIDTSLFFTEREAVCKDGTEIHAKGNKGESDADK